METMISPQVGMRLRPNIKKEKEGKSEAKKSPRKTGKEKKNKKIKNERKERRGMLIPHLCFKVALCFSYKESPMLSLSYTSGNFSL